MATNPPPGAGRKGAVKERSQVFNPKTADWTKREKKSGKFMDRKADPKPFKRRAQGKAIAVGLDTRLTELKREVRPLELFVHAFAQTLGDPIFYHSGKSHAGFRYAKPDIRHFCLLKLVRAVSALNAMICLARQGFTQEIAVLVRTIAECTTLIEFVMVSRKPDGSLGAEASELIESFFADFARNDIADYKKSKLRQGFVHETIGTELDSFIASNEGGAPPSIPAEQLYSRTYLAFSGYVHCKYPETMDLYGGAGPHFHLCGMLGTPKDAENVAYLETFIETVSLSVRSVIVRLGLLEVVQRDPELLAWHRTTSAVPWTEAS